MNEFGMSHNPENPEEGLENIEDKKEIPADVEKVLAQIELLEHVSSNNEDSLNEFTETARESVDASNKDAWVKLLQDTLHALQDEADPDVVEDIFREAQTEAALIQSNTESAIIH